MYVGEDGGEGAGREAVFVAESAAVVDVELFGGHVEFFEEVGDGGGAGLPGSLGVVLAGGEVVVGAEGFE